jgi:hypothetical protein
MNWNSMWKISPNYEMRYLNPPTSIERFIDVYEDRINGWMIKQAKYLSKKNHSGYAILHTVISYFESYAMFARGKVRNQGETKKLFIDGFLSVFDSYLMSEEDASKIAVVVYEDLRCGLDHYAFPRGRIALVDSKRPIDWEIVDLDEELILRVYIDCPLFVKAIEIHSKNYVLMLRNKNYESARIKFENVFVQLNWGSPDE